MSTALQLGPTPGINVTINYNATITNVTELVGTTMVYTIIALLCTWWSYSFVASSLKSRWMPGYYKSKEKGDLMHFLNKYTLSTDKGESNETFDLTIRILMGIVLPWTLFAVAWSLYTGTVLGAAWIFTGQSRTGVRLVVPQDIFNYSFSGLCCGVITITTLYLAARSRVRYETPGMVLAKYVMWVLMFGAVVLLPGAYGFTWNTDVTVAQNGYLAALTLATGLVLTIVLVLRVGLFARAARASDQMDAMVLDVHILSTGVQGDLKGATYGFAPGINLPLTWIIAHYAYITAAGYLIYMDNTKPIVFSTVVCIVPWVLTLKSRQIYSYMAWHVALSAYWILVNVISASITGPLGSGFAPTVTSFVASNNVTYYNITLNPNTTQSEFFLTGPSPSMLPNMRTSTDFFSIGAFVISCIVILLNLMFFEPALTSGIKDPARVDEYGSGKAN